MPLNSGSSISCRRRGALNPQHQQPQRDAPLVLRSVLVRWRRRRRRLQPSDRHGGGSGGGGGFLLLDGGGGEEVGVPPLFMCVGWSDSPGPNGSIDRSIKESSRHAPQDHQGTAVQQYTHTAHDNDHIESNQLDDQSIDHKQAHGPS